MIGELSRRAGRGSVGAVAAADVAYLSGAMFSGGVTDPRDAADLVAFDRLVVADAPEWAAFFVNAISSHLLEHTSPAAAVTPEKTEWLVGQLSDPQALNAVAEASRIGSGHIGQTIAESARALPLVLRVMEGARAVAPELPAFALRQILAAIITGEGPLSAGRIHFSRVVDAPDVALLRRVLAAGGGGDGRPVSRQEADALFDIHDATCGAANDPAFEPLFVRAVVQHVRAASNLHAGSRASLSTPSVDTFNGVHMALDMLALAGFRRDLDALVEKVTLTRETADWLTERLSREGRVSSALSALARLLADSSGAVPETLRALVDHAA